jgi:hypothetical protein
MGIRRLRHLQTVLSMVLRTVPHLVPRTILAPKLAANPLMGVLRWRVNPLMAASRVIPSLQAHRFRRNLRSSQERT